MVIKKVTRKIVKKKAPPKDKVVFRKFDGEVIALFPEDKADYSGNVTSYSHIGQHSAANFGYVMQKSKKATPREYADLKKELTSIGYKLDVKQKYIRPRR